MSTECKQALLVCPVPVPVVPLLPPVFPVPVPLLPHPHPFHKELEKIANGSAKSPSDKECDNGIIGRAAPFPIPYLGLVYIYGSIFFI